MSKQDSKFFNTFSLVLGILIVITVVLFSLAGSVGDNTQRTFLLSDAKYLAAVKGRVGEAGVAVVGQDNSALAIAPAAGIGPLVAVALPADGPAVYETVCGACHMNGIAGAPRSDDKALGPAHRTGHHHALQTRHRRLPRQGRLHAAQGWPCGPHGRARAGRRRPHDRPGAVSPIRITPAQRRVPAVARVLRRGAPPRSRSLRPDPPAISPPASNDGVIAG